MVVDADAVARPTQVVGEIGGDAYTAMVTGTKVRWVLDLVRGTEFAGRTITAFTITEPDRDEGRYDIALHEAGPGDTPQDLGAVRERLLALGEAGATVRLRLVAAPLRRVLFDTGEIPGFGWSTFRTVDGPGTPQGSDVLANEHLRVEIDPATGTYAIETADGLRASGLGRLVDDGDGGDTYSYSPPTVDRVIDTPERVTVTSLESGPVRRRVRIDADYSWPARAIGDYRSCSARSDDTRCVTVHTTLELRAGERFLRVTHELDNQARDHRLRVHFPLPAPVTGSDAECAFSVVHRGLTAEGGPQEFGLPTFPSRRFVDASDGTAGLALLHDGLLEYEVVGDGRELALTLLRSVGYLSRSEPALRPAPAGPTLGVRGALMLGEQRAEYAVLLHAGDWRAADCYGAADAFLVPFERARAAGNMAPSRPASGAALRVDGAEVSAVLRERGRLVVRVFRTAPGPGPVTIEHEGAPARGWVVDLRGEHIAPFDGSVDLRPWELCTFHLDP